MRKLSRVGDTGKLYFVKNNCYTSNKVNNDAVTRPTSIASFNINDLTVHSLSHLPIEHGIIPKYNKLLNDK